jgi:putative FmdB family regulatory protein
MPIYEYQCNACGHDHEALQKLGAEPLLLCPACDAPALKKKISAAGFRLKGAGWYETDFKAGAKKNVAGENNSGGEKKPAEKSAEKSTAPAACSSSCACH